MTLTLPDCYSKPDSCLNELSLFTGGLLAFLAVYFGRDMLPWADEITCTLATAIAAASAQLIGQRAGSAYAAKLSTVTFVLVVMGSKDAPSKAPSFDPNYILL